MDEDCRYFKQKFKDQPFALILSTDTECFENKGDNKSGQQLQLSTDIELSTDIDGNR